MWFICVVVYMDMVWTWDDFKWCLSTTINNIACGHCVTLKTHTEWSYCRWWCMVFIVNMMWYSNGIRMIWLGYSKIYKLLLYLYLFLCRFFCLAFLLFRVLLCFAVVCFVLIPALLRTMFKFMWFWCVHPQNTSLLFECLPTYY